MSNKKRETDEEKIKRYKSKEEIELDNVADMADEDATVSDAYGGSVSVDSEFADRFEDEMDKKIKKRTDAKIDKALKK